MKNKLSLVWSLLIVVIIGVLLYSILGLSAQSPKIISIDQPSTGLPLRFKIPSINVDTTIEPVGLTPAGAMDVPQKPDDVAWFNLGPRPGEIGSAVIAGHSGWKDNRPATFDNLDKLKIGDKIYIKDDQGKTITFVVRENRKYNQKADATTVFSSADDGVHLNLVTCIGDWNARDQTHSERLVVFADKE